jgi:hypothetical protein
MFVLLLLATTFHVESRPELGPPSIQLKTEISNIAVVKLEKKSPNKLTFALVKNIHNQATEHIHIRTTEQVSSALSVGESYVIGYIAWQVNKPNKEVLPREGGAVLMSLPGAEPAIFKDVAEINDILAVDVEDSLSSPQTMLPLIKAGLASDDFQIRNFFVTELITRKSFMQDPAIQVAIEELILNGNVAWRIKHFILANEGLNTSQLNSKWFKQWAIDTLKYSSTQFDLNRSEPALIVQLIKKSEHFLANEQSAVLKRWINSNHMGVIESTLDALKMIDLDAAISIVNNRLQQTMIDDSMRITLKNYLKRLNNQKNK